MASQAMFLFGVVLCVGLASCASPNSEKPTAKQATGSPENQVSVPKTGLSKAQVIDLATAEARRKGWDANNCTVEHDEPTTRFRNFIAPLWLPGDRDEMGQEHDYHVVTYRRPEVGKEGLLGVFIDAKTGKVITSVIWPTTSAYNTPYWYRPYRP